MKKRVIALMLAFVLVLNMGTVAFANGEATPAPVTETEPTPTPAAEATPTPTPVVEETPTPTPAADPTPTSTPAVEATPTPTPTPEVVLASIRVTQMPDKLEYLCTDTAVDSTGGTLMLTFSDGTTQVVDLSAATLSLVKENANTASVNVAYEGMTDSFAVTVTHSYDEGVVTTEATATELGVMTYTCADCGDEQTGELPMVASTEIASGTCGDNLTWSLSENGVLTISGTGEMDNYEFASLSSRPWHEYISEIKEIVIQSGVTGIGNYAFDGCSSLESITIPDSVTSIKYCTFSNCRRLTDIVMPASASITQKAFYGCSNITSVILTKGTGTMTGNASIHHSHDAPWYKYGNNNVSVTIEDGVKNIGTYTFSDCDGLTSIKISDSVTNIGDGAFYGCSGLTSIEIPDSVTSIDRAAFFYCNRLTSIEIPDSVTNIGSRAFYGCNNLSSISIPDSVDRIEFETFRVCSNLSSITMPASASILEDAFLGCTGVTSVTLTKGTGTMTDYETSSSADKNYYQWTPWYIARNNNVSVTIEDGVKNIGSYAFYYSGLTNITIPGSVTEINQSAFSGSSGLTNVTILDGVKYIRPYAFNGCSKLTNITMPDSVTSIGSNAFDSCSGLTSITMPASANIGTDAFSGCTGVTSVTLTKGTGTMTDYGTDSSADKNYYGWTPWYVARNNNISITIEDGITNIGSRAFAGCSGLTSIKIPDGVTSISSLAFADCSSLTSIEIPDSVTSIGSCAFKGCSGLTNVEIPDNVTSIGSEAFKGCSRLMSIEIPDGVTNIGNRAFEDCSGLTSIVIPDSVTIIGYKAFSGCSNLSNITILGNETGFVDAAFQGCSSLKTAGPIGGGYDYEFEWTTQIPFFAFQGCTGLTSITIPDSVNRIGFEAFEDCSSLSSITMPASASILEEAFLGCTGVTSVTLTKGAGTMIDYGKNSSANENYYQWTPWYIARNNNISITIEDGVTNIGSYAFSGYSRLTSIEIPDSVTSIGSGAFEGCSGLTNVEIPDNVNSIGKYAFYNCSGLTNITIPGSITEISQSAFSGCSGLTNITILDGVKYIRSNAFNGCTKLTSIELPDSVTSIASNAFNGCTKLTSIEIPDSVTSIGSCAFEGCTKLTSITMPASASISASAFYGCTGVTSVTLTKGTGTMTDYGISGYKHTPWYVGRNNNISVTIEDGVTNIGKYAFYGCTGLTSITIPDKVASIGDLAFQDCSGLTEITFKGDAPTIADDAFTNVTATAKYLHMKNWPEDALENYGGTLTWQICCDNFEECEIVTDEAVAPTFDSTGLTEGSHCSVCEKPIVAQNELPKLAVTELEITAPDKLVYYKGESLDSTGLTVTAKLNNDTNIDVTDQVQLEGFSSNAAGTKTITVSFKDAQATFDVQVFSFTSVSLSLEGRVIINFYANFPDYAEAGYTPGILFFREQPNASEIIRAYSVGEGINTYAVNDDGTLMFSYDKLAAKELNDKVYATLYVEQSDGNVVFGEPAPISVADYAISAFNRFADQPLLQTLMVDMLNFGAAAQNEFDYRTDALANSNMSATMAAKATKDNVSLSNGMKLYNDGLSSDKVTIKSASLSLDNEISINFYAEIKGDIKKAELLIFDEYTAGGVYDKNTASKRTDMVPHEDMYAGFITGIAAKSMRDLYYARVYVQFEDGTEAYSGIGQYSVESYAWQVRNGSGFSSKLKLLMEEMMKYGDSAKMYMENKNNNANG